ncbi:hypothetical protein KCP76_03500 [Salmonella enterica subsp. enterica serovar Weltevreden]|nr:hypothetical protein KCP76_03500 [Salmonella enterica subsp. enterica serovar Weltevreden]
MIIITNTPSERCTTNTISFDHVMIFIRKSGKRRALSGGSASGLHCFTCVWSRRQSADWGTDSHTRRPPWIINDNCK